jgi:DNA mismatch repair ATPase MutS
MWSSGEVLARLGKREELEASIREVALELLSAQQALDTLLETAILTREQYGRDLVEARIGLSEAQQILDELDSEEFRNDLDDQELAAQEAKDELDEAQEELDKYLDLDPENPTRENAQTAYDNALSAYNDAVFERDRLQNQLDQAQAAVELAAASLDEAQREYEQRKDGADPDALALAEARVA